MFLLDLSHTSHTRARTGIQRVCRSLHTTLGENASAITWDPYAQQWRTLNSDEKTTLATHNPANKRGVSWPLSARIQGHWQTFRGRRNKLPDAEGIIVPELFSPEVHDAFPLLPAQLPRVAIFHDAIALKLPELTPPGTVARFPGYMQELLTFSGIAAVSEDSRLALLDYWHWLGHTQTPPIETIPLGIDSLHGPSAPPDPNAPPIILCVGSIEGRKNHLSLLQACEQLWSHKRSFQLRLIGMANPTTGKHALQKIKALTAAGRPLRYDGAVDENTLNAAYRECLFTVYPSLMEGFGLPVLESLQRGKPCICSSEGALGESARPGGALMLNELTPESLAGAIDSLLQNSKQRSLLASVARSRSYRTWADYTSDLVSWIKSLN